MSNQINRWAYRIWTCWLLPSPLARLSAGLYLAGLAVYGYSLLTGSYSLPTPWLSSLLVGIGVLLLVGCDRLEDRYHDAGAGWWMFLLLMLARMGLIGLIGAQDGLGSMPESTLMLLIFVSFFLVAGRSFGLTGMVWLLYLLTCLHLESERVAGSARLVSGQHDLVRDLTFLLVIVLTLAFIVSLTVQARRERSHRLRVEALLHEREEAHRQLQTYAERVAELATSEERNRLARDIHDSLGHAMTVINIQLEKAIAFRERNPAEADEAVRTAKRLAREALQEVRRSVSTLRATHDPFSLLPALTDLVQTARSAQLEVVLDTAGSEAGFSHQSLVTLYRAIQEGLTNIQKHAHASQVLVQLRLGSDDPDTASLLISDNGQGFDPPAVSTNQTTHYGLQGVRERLELIQGTIQIESAPGQGTQLLITVPRNPLAVLPYGDGHERRS